jgi:DNA ligase-associated metallophosphoesterase
VPQVVSDRAEIRICDETLLLLADRAVVWPARRTLFLADLHLGKDEVFRRAGVAVPSGVVETDLGRLTRLIESHAVRRVVMLGDFVHARPRVTTTFVTEFRRWRDGNADVDVIVVAGNHDRHMAGHELSGMVEWCEREWIDGPFVGRHHPGADIRGYVLSGHIHPVIKLVSGRERMRLPVFWFTAGHAVLPSFGTFTGGAEIDPSTDDRVYVIGEGSVVALPVRR